jgi:hypothetical protein
MNWLKNLLQEWLEVKVQHQCGHKWEVLEEKAVEELFQMPPVQYGDRWELPNLDTNTYKLIKTKYIMTCKKCGDLKAEIL